MSQVNVGSWMAEIAQYLHNNTFGVFGSTPTANIFLGALPDSPVLAVGLISTGGPVYQGDPLNHCEFQALIRRTKNMDGLQYATTLFNLLDDKWNITPSFSGRIVAQHRPGPFYLSAGGSFVYTLNFRAVLGRK